MTILDKEALRERFEQEVRNATATLLRRAIEDFPDDEELKELNPDDVPLERNGIGYEDRITELAWLMFISGSIVGVELSKAALLPD